MTRTPLQDRTQPRLRRRTGDEAGFTLVEVLLTVAILGVVMLPLLGFLLITLQRGNDTATPADTTAFAQVSQFLNRDLASSIAAIEKDSAAASDAPNSCPTAGATGESYDPAESTNWLWIQTSERGEIVYLAETTADGTRLLRTTCERDAAGALSGTETTLLAEDLTDVEAPGAAPGDPEVPISVACSERPGKNPDTDRCGEVTVTLAGSPRCAGLGPSGAAHQSRGPTMTRCPLR